MRWVYVPTMFALAFIYTKISLNSVPTERDSVGKNGRSPSSVSNEVVKYTTLKDLPVSSLYQKLNDSLFAEYFRSVALFEGTIGGDLRVENFGFIIDDKRNSFFSLRHIQDVGHGVLARDVLVHLVSAKYLDKKISWIPYFEAYKNGLRNLPHTYSYYIEKGLEESEGSVKKSFEENVTADFPFEFTQMKNFGQHVAVVKKNLIQDGLKKKYPKIQFFDLYVSFTDENRYQALVRIRPQDKIEWLELEKSAESAYDKVFVKESPTSFEDRFAILTTDVFNERLNHSLETVMIDKKPYLIKSADNFSAKLKLEEIPSDDYVDIVLDEAYVLGQLHRKSLEKNSKTDAYIKAWATIPAVTIDEKVIEIKYKLRDEQE